MPEELTAFLKEKATNIWIGFRWLMLESRVASVEHGNGRSNSVSVGKSLQNERPTLTHECELVDDSDGNDT
jgi:hypothetical protein